MLQTIGFVRSVSIVVAYIVVRPSAMVWFVVHRMVVMVVVMAISVRMIIVPRTIPRIVITPIPRIVVGITIIVAIRTIPRVPTIIIPTIIVVVVIDIHIGYRTIVGGIVRFYFHLVAYRNDIATVFDVVNRGVVTIDVHQQVFVMKFVQPIGVGVVFFRQTDVGVGRSCNRNGGCGCCRRRGRNRYFDGFYICLGIKIDVVVLSKNGY